MRLKSIILFSVFISQLETRLSLTPFATQHSKFNSRIGGCKNSKMHVGEKTCILEVQVLALYIHTHTSLFQLESSYRVEIKLRM